MEDERDLENRIIDYCIESDIDASRISVTVKDGDVVLSGTVDNEEKKPAPKSQNTLRRKSLADCLALFRYLLTLFFFAAGRVALTVVTLYYSIYAAYNSRNPGRPGVIKKSR